MLFQNLHFAEETRHILHTLALGQEGDSRCGFHFLSVFVFIYVCICVSICIVYIYLYFFELS